MRLSNVAAPVSIAVAVLSIGPLVLVGAPSARADISGYRRCVASVKQVPINEHDPLSLQLARQVEMDLDSGVSPDAEAQRVAQMGFDSQLANTVVQCAAYERP
ncbi:hypothetical protein [Mycobacterium sp. Marseille-P9652]|uniref:hypothetical protein n=1 Tax=Mycobacterium sp. Marseille-P9652 TaxID=2654950 RepID=UPI0012E773E3|nr:hypothetical protein [Mycobacterium sp. Marseille-P9652]